MWEVFPAFPMITYSPKIQVSTGRIVYLFVGVIAVIAFLGQYYFRFDYFWIRVWVWVWVRVNNSARSHAKKEKTSE